MNFKKTLLIALSAIVMTGFMAGCGSDTKESDKSAKPKVVKFAGEVTYPPFEFAEDGKYKGFDVELSKAIGKEIGVEVEYVAMGFDALIPALESKQIDVICSGMTITEEREKKVSFSKPYLVDQLVVVVKKDNDSFKTLADLKGKAIGVQIGTTGSFLATKEGAQTKSFDTVTTLLEDVDKGGVAGAIINEPVAKYYIEKGNLKNLKTVNIGIKGANLGLAVNKDNKELLDKINNAIDQMKADGSYAELQKKWFGTAQ